MPMLPDTAIEIVRPDVVRGHIRHALFDFDGTLSLIRQGWQQVMAPLMVEALLDTPQHEPEAEIQQVVQTMIDRTTGIQTIYQMIELAEAVRARGGTPLEPTAYKRRYLELLWQHISERVRALKAGETPRDALLLPGSVAFLESLRARGITCYVASGTDLEYVRDEVNALGLEPYFGEQVYGALENWEDFSKAKLIARILRNHDLQGPEIVTFGDGFVEIENTVAVGGIAVGVASDEVHPTMVDSWKRERLIRAGAHLIIPNFVEAPALMRYLLAEDGRGAPA